MPFDASVYNDLTPDGANNMCSSAIQAVKYVTKRINGKKVTARDKIIPAPFNKFLPVSQKLLFVQF